jgi:thiamine kinase-like enzyme
MDQAIAVVEEGLGKDSPIAQSIIDFKTKSLERVMRLFVGDDMSQIFPDVMRIKPAKDEDSGEPWKVITHGDCWSNNMLFRYDSSTGLPVEITLVDLQLAQHACITHDLAYIVYASTTTDFRKKYQDELLQLYFDTFNASCDTLKCSSLPGFTMNSFKARFHKAKVAGFMYGITILPFVLKEDDKTVDLEKMDPNKDLASMFQEGVSENSCNAEYKKRILELTQELHEQGIL